MIEIDAFVPRSEIDERYLDSPYYIGPNEPVGQEAFAVIREAMRQKDMVALGRVVLAKRERVIMLQPWKRVSWARRSDTRTRSATPRIISTTSPDVKIAPEMLTLAEHILKSKETNFDPSKFVDRYEQAVIQLLEKKREGMPAPKVETFVAPTNVVSLMDALRRSVAEDAGVGAAPKKTAAAQPQKGKKRVPGQGELLMPIAGRKAEARLKLLSLIAQLQRSPNASIDVENELNNLQDKYLIGSVPVDFFPYVLRLTYLAKDNGIEESFIEAAAEPPARISEVDEERLSGHFAFSLYEHFTTRRSTDELSKTTLNSLRRSAVYGDLCAIAKDEPIIPDMQKRLTDQLASFCRLPKTAGKG